MKNIWTYKRFDEIMKPAKVIKCGQRDDLPVLSITMHGGIVNQNERFGKTIASKDRSNYKVVKNGQLVIAFPIDEGLLYTQDVAPEGIMSPAYNIWDVDYNQIDKRFLVSFFHSDFAFAYYKAKLRGSTQRRRSMDKGDLLSMPIPVPELSVQKQIVSELDLLRGIIEKQNAQIDELGRFTQAIFYEMFGDPITNEMGWEMKKLGEEVTDMKYGTSRPACENGKYKYLRMGNITMDGYLDLSDIKTIDVPEGEIEKCIVRYGDILFNRTNSHELIGKTCMFDLSEDMVIAGYIIRVRLSEKVLPRYFSIMFNLPSIRKYLRSIAKGAVNQANINSKELSSIKIPVPPLFLQQEFAAKIESIESMKAKVRKSMKESEELFKSRMDYYFN